MSEAKYIYLIQAHEHPLLIARWIRLLADDQSVFYIHLDSKSDISQFNPLLRCGRVQFTEERVDCIWGDFSQVEASLILVRKALTNHSSGVVSLLSGSHYPIKSKQMIQEFLSANYQTCFLECKNPNELWINFSKRSEYYKFQLSSKRGDYVLLKGWSLTALSQLLKQKISLSQFLHVLLKKRFPPNGISLFGGSQWWSMSVEQLKAINDYINQHEEKLKEFYWYSLCADEFFFQSIAKHLASQLDYQFGDSTTYVSWDRHKCKTPITFRSDLHELMSLDAHKLFARKFDPKLDITILDEIDKHILAGSIKKQECE